MTPTQHLSVVIKYLLGNSREVILFYSGGKDSLVLLDILSKNFTKVHCVFMYFVKDLEHMRPYMNWVKRYENASLIELPHWMTSYYLKHGHMGHLRPEGDDIKSLRQADIEKEARRLTGCQWIVFGHKMADNMTRRIMLKGYTFDAINESLQKVYPLSHWSKGLCQSYIDGHKLIKPTAYGTKNSQGMDLTEDVLLFLRENYPNDLQKVLDVFPLSGKILFEYDYKTASSPGV